MCAKVYHSHTESMLFPECGVLREPHSQVPVPPTSCSGRGGGQLRRSKAKAKVDEKPTSEKLFRLTSFPARNLEKCRKFVPKPPKGLPDDVKLSSETGLFRFGGHLHFKRPYKGLAHNSCLRGVKADTEAFEKPSQKRALKKTTQIRARISFFRKS